MGKVVVVDIEDVVDVNVAVVTNVDADGVKALVMGVIVPLVVYMLVCWRSCRRPGRGC